MLINLLLVITLSLTTKKEESETFTNLTFVKLYSNAYKHCLNLQTSGHEGMIQLPFLLRCLHCLHWTDSSHPFCFFL